MRGLERAVEWLRPSKAWDYCVVWKLGDDPSRFIEWMGCCCSGASVDGEDMCGKVKKEREEEKHLAPFCGDVCFRHPVRTKACQALAQFPTFLPLYSGIHGEAGISTRARWLKIHANTSNSSSPHESVGTRVLVPVSSAIIELFAAKHVAEDWNIIELINRQCTIGKEEAMIPQGYSNGSFKNQEHCPAPLFKKFAKLDTFLPFNFSNPAPSTIESA